MSIEVIERREIGPLFSYEFYVPEDWREQAKLAGWQFSTLGEVGVDKGAPSRWHLDARLHYRVDSRLAMVLLVDTAALDDKERRALVVAALAATGSACVLSGIV
jgi:hypothetical protein